MTVVDWDLIGLLMGTVITLLIFSYVLGDNFLFRWVLAVLVGGGVGYALGVTWHYVLLRWFTRALNPAAPVTERVFYVIPMFLGMLLLLKGFTSPKFQTRLGLLGNIPMGYLLGVGATVAISGALVGTLIPQAFMVGNAIAASDGLGVQGVLALMGTIAAFMAFSPRPSDKAGRFYLVEHIWQRIGRFFIVVALAVAFSGAITSALTTLVLQVWRVFQLFFPS